MSPGKVENTGYSWTNLSVFLNPFPTWHFKQTAALISQLQSAQEIHNGSLLQSVWALASLLHNAPCNHSDIQPTKSIASPTPTVKHTLTQNPKSLPTLTSVHQQRKCLHKQFMVAILITGI